MTEIEVDRLLVVRAQEGDEVAFGLLVKRHRGRLMRQVMRQVANPADAEEIVQETFFKAYKALASFRGDARFYTWLYKISHNTVGAFRAGEARRTQFVVEQRPDWFNQMRSQSEGELGTPEAILASRQTANAIDRTLTTMPYEFSNTLVLREIEEFSYAEIAMIMDCPENTVRSRLYRAREMIDEALRAQSKPTRGPS